MLRRKGALPLAALLLGGCVTIAPAPGSSVGPGSSSGPMPSIGRPSMSITTSLPASLPPPAQPTPVGAASVVVVIDSGQDAGTYAVSGDPACSYGVVDAGTWAAQYGNLMAGPTDLSTLQLTDSPDSSKAGARIVSVYATVGPIFGGRGYTLSLDRFNDAPYVRDVQDNGSTAVIHIAGNTIQSPLGPGGVGVDVTLNCPAVSRG